jgi:hypothetical protein
MSRFFIDRPVVTWAVAIVLMLASAVAVLTQAGQQFYQAPHEASLARAQAALLHAHASGETAQSIVSCCRPFAAASAVSRQTSHPSRP